MTTKEKKKNNNHIQHFTYGLRFSIFLIKLYFAKIMQKKKH